MAGDEHGRALCVCSRTVGLRAGAAAVEGQRWRHVRHDIRHRRGPWKVGRDLAAHEKYHRDQQWNQDGLLFPGLYYRAEVIDVWIGGGCNRYEAAAEAASNGGGGYTC